MRSARKAIDYKAVRRYFEGAADGNSAAASYMAHDQDLPPDAVAYRFNKEQSTVADWLAAVPTTAAVLDVGCGAGVWTCLFASRYARVFGIEGSRTMAEAARKRTQNAANVTILEGDARFGLPDEKFGLIFLGGLSMYLDDDDFVDLLRNLRKRADVGHSIILRESTVAGQRHSASGEYQAVYRTVAEYHALFRQAGYSQIVTRRNYGYTAMEIAIECVEARRRWLPLLPKRSMRLGAATWWCLRLASPATFCALPRLLKGMGVRWPKLQNHFFRLSG